MVVLYGSAGVKSSGENSYDPGRIPPHTVSLAMTSEMQAAGEQGTLIHFRKIPQAAVGGVAEPH